MQNLLQKVVSEPNLLRVMIQLHDWECCQRKVMQTLTGRELYFRIAEVCLDDSQSPHLLKSFQGKLTERAMRQRIKEFQEIGFICILNNTLDKRRRSIVPTDKFLKHLNQHLKLFKYFCDSQFFMVKK